MFTGGICRVMLVSGIRHGIHAYVSSGLENGAYPQQKLARNGHGSLTSTFIRSLATLLLLLGGACARIEWEGIWGASSPNGVRLATLFRNDPSATSDFSYRLEIQERHSNGEWGSAREVWSDYGCMPLYILWCSDSELEIHLDSKVERCAETSTTGDPDISMHEIRAERFLVKDSCRSDAR